MSARRLLIFGGIALIAGGMLFGDIFAVFVLHQNGGQTGQTLLAATEAVRAGNSLAVKQIFEHLGGLLEDHGTKLDAHVHMTDAGYLAILLALLQPYVALPHRRKKLLAGWFVSGGLSHFKLHELSGFGGALKNLGMGCASRKGKLAQHSNISPKVTAKKCTGCGECVVHCAQEAIRINPETEKAVIDPTKCVGCAECLLVCPYGNIQIQWNESIPVFLKKMMEYASGVMKFHRHRSVFVSFITQVSPACYCYGHNDLPIVGDIGILASRDPVAIDQACADLVIESPGIASSSLKDLSPGSDKFKDIYPQVDWHMQLEYAAELGLGAREYELVKV